METELPEDRVHFLADVLITAVEGGINLWASTTSYMNIPASDAYADLIDREDRSRLGQLNINIVDLGFYRIAYSPMKINPQLRATILAANALQDAGDIDAEAADAIVQAGLFGKLVYG